jgi:hypothetical protein
MARRYSEPVELSKLKPASTDGIRSVSHAETYVGFTIAQETHRLS